MSCGVESAASLTPSASAVIPIDRQPRCDSSIAIAAKQNYLSWKYLYHPLYRAPSPAAAPTPSHPVTMPVAPPGYDLRNQLPQHLHWDPRVWNRQDVQSWLQWCQEEFDLPPIETAQFALNGKALCLLMRSDFAERAPRAGDVLYNTIQILLKEAAETSEHGQYRLPRQLRFFGYCGVGISGSELSRSVDNHSTSWPVVSSDFHNLGHVLQQQTYHPSVINSSTRLLGSSPSTSGVESTITLSPAPSSSDSHRADGSTPPAPRSPRMSPQQQQHLDSHHVHHSPPHSGGVIRSSSPHPIPPNGVHVNGLRLSPRHAGHSDYEDNGREVHSPMAQTHLPNHVGLQQDHLINGNVLPPAGEPITNGRLLWDFLHQLLNDPAQRYVSCIRWKDRGTGIFKITDPGGLARLWGMQKNHLNMNFDKMSRALRYYYRVNILRKVQGERHCYQFLRQPTELKACKQRALLNKMRINNTNGHPCDKPIDMSLGSINGIGGVATIKTEEVVR